MAEALARSSYWNRAARTHGGLTKRQLNKALPNCRFVFVGSSGILANMSLPTETASDVLERIFRVGNRQWRSKEPGFLVVAPFKTKS
jgi:hypothetical protein